MDILLKMARHQKQNKTALGFFIFSLLSLLGLGGHQARAQPTEEIGLNIHERAYLDHKKILRVCVDPSRLPFDGVDEAGNHDGLSKDVFDIIARMLNVTMVVPVVEDWDDLMTKAKSRACDVVSQINANDERREFLDFTTPYFYLPLAVVTRYDRIFVEESLQGSGVKFAVIKDDIAIDKLRKKYPDIDLVEVKNNIEAMQMVHDGDVFGYIGAQGAVAFAIQKLDLSKLAVTGSLPLRYELSIASRNDEPYLGSALEKAVRAIDPKEAQSIRDKWIAITIQEVTDYTLIWQILGVLGTVLMVSLFWNNRLSHANRKIRETLDHLHAAQQQLEDQNKALQKQSLTDSLTGLCNRLKLDQDIAQEIQRAKRTNSALSLILLDLDHFKQINDTHGHLIGDEVLKEFAQLLQSQTRSSDILGRWGGEEFLLLCPDCPLDGAKTRAEQLRAIIAAHDFPQIGTLTASFGVATYQAGEAPDNLLKRADVALYGAKEKGRNCVDCG